MWLRSIVAGFQSVLFADLRSVKEVEDAISSVRAEPNGKNGSTLNRAAKYFNVGKGEFDYCVSLDVVVMRDYLIQKATLL